MKKIGILITVILLVCLCTMPLVGCKDTTDNVIRLNEVTHSVFYAPLYVAINEGYFEEEGLTIELTNGGGADKVMTAVIAGQADIGLCGPEAVIYVYNEGRRDYPQVIGQLTRMDGSFVIGRDDTPFDWATSLKGKEIIGGRRGGVPAMALEYCLRHNGYTIGQDVTVNYDVQFDLITAAFEGGVGDLCTMFEPAASTFARAGKGYIKTSVGAECGEIPYTAFCATKEYLSKNADNARAFLRAVQRGVDYVATHTDAEIAKSIAPSFAGVDVELLATSVHNYKAIQAIVTDMHLSQTAFERLQDVIVEAGIMNTRAAYEKVVDLSYLP